MTVPSAADPVFDQAGGQLLRQLPGQVGVAVGRGDGGGAHLLDVGVGKAENDAVGKHAGARQLAVGELV